MHRLLPFLLSMLFVAVAQAQTVVEVIVNSEDHTTLETAVIAAGLDDDLAGDGPFTVFAPTDEAFEMLDDETVAYFLNPENQDSLVSLLMYHVITDSVRSSALTDGMRAENMLGDSLYFRTRGDSVTVNGVLITMADITATNGVVHVIDMVLMPPAETVADIIMDSEDHTTLEAALVAAELDSVLMGAGPFTVFAPNDSAFAAIPDSTLDALLDDPMGNLSSILRYHVVAGTYYSSDLMDGMMLTTVQGQMIEVSVMNDTIMVDSVMITMPDLMARNGVVHSLSGILMPDLSVSTREEPTFAREVSIAPNPATNIMTVNLPFSILDNTTLTLRDFNGRVVLSRRATSDRERLEVGNLPAGPYLLEVRAEAGVIQRKVMVQR